MVKNKFQGKKGRKRKGDMRDCPERKHYEEFGEAHPVDDRSDVKRLRVEDIDDKEESRLSDDDVSSEDEQEDTDAVSRLLATFKTNPNSAVDSDDDEEEEEEEEEESEEEEDSEDDDAPSGSDIEDNDMNDINHQLEGDDDDPGVEVSQKLNGNDYAEDEDDAGQDEDDPFTRHFQRNLDSDSAENIRKSECWSSSYEMWPTLKRIRTDAPKAEVKKEKPLLLACDDDDNVLPDIGAVPKPPNKKNYCLEDLHVLQPLRDNIPLIEDNNSICDSGFTEIQKELFAVLSNYSDLYYPESTHEKYEDIKTVYAVHALNHALKTRKRVLRHNSKIKKERIKKSKKGMEHCYRDQGYTRPKVLIILPFKHSAYRVVEIMSSLLQSDNFEVLKHSRFKEDYGPQDNQDPFKKLNRAEDFHENFKGNSSEDFKIGVKVTRRTLKLYTNFFESDIIISSPLGLRCLMGGSELGSSETDFLSSIEVLIIDQADVLMMQNWEHVLILMEIMNKPPRSLLKLETDLTRIRMWTLDGHASLYRQTVLFSSIHVDHGRALISKCRNFAGRIQVLNPVTDGSVQEVVAEAELVLTRIPGMYDSEKRFQYFIKEVLPQYQANRHIGVMVYIPDYCDYVRLVKYLKEDGGTSFTSINEYISGETAKIAKRRSDFFDGKKQFLLYTERFHFYRRYRIKGVRHLIFYDLPTYPHFFSEICNFMVAGNQNRRTQKRHIGKSTATVLYQQTDVTKLVGVLGSKRAGEIMKANKPIHVCVLGT